MREGTLPARVRIVEVGPRDGLQNEPAFVPTAAKVELIDRLVSAGVRAIEAAAFVSPKWVPQMADGAQVLRDVTRKPGVVFGALVPNLTGLAAARAAHCDEVAVFGAASETFSRKNINASIAESLERFVPVVDGARGGPARARLCVLRARLPVRGGDRSAAGGFGGGAALSHGMRRDQPWRHDRRRHAAEGAPDDRGLRAARAARAARGTLSRYVGHGGGERRRGAAGRRRDTRQLGIGHRRMSVLARRDGQRGDRGYRLSMPRARDRDGDRPGRTRRGRPFRVDGARAPECVARRATG